VLLELGLQRPLNLMVGVLSRGEQRRVANCASDPQSTRLLLLDEPDVWLDSEGRASLGACSIDN